MTEYVEVCVVATCETAEALSDFLFAEGALGLVTEDLPGEPGGVTIRATFVGGLPVGPLVERLRRYQGELAALGLTCAQGQIEVRDVPSQDWDRVWMDHFPPILVGQRLAVAPPWVTGPFPGDRLVIRILPAMAFGTGYDATTRLCLEALEAFMDQWAGTGGPNVLDLGTGTGILAIAAAALGAYRVLALDTDLEACMAARKNLALNPGAGRIEIVCGGVQALRGARRFDLLLANLDTRILCDLLDILPTLLALGGRLIAGGIRTEELEIVTTALQGLPLRIIARRAEGEWLRLTLAGKES